MGRCEDAGYSMLDTGENRFHLSPFTELICLSPASLEPAEGAEKDGKYP